MGNGACSEVDEYCTLYVVCYYGLRSVVLLPAFGPRQRGHIRQSKTKNNSLSPNVRRSQRQPIVNGAVSSLTTNLRPVTSWLRIV